MLLAAAPVGVAAASPSRSEEHTSELQSQSNLVCRLLLEKKQLLLPAASAANIDISEIQACAPNSSTTLADSFMRAAQLDNALPHFSWITHLPINDLFVPP